MRPLEQVPQQRDLGAVVDLLLDEGADLVAGGHLPLRQVTRARLGELTVGGVGQPCGDGDPALAPLGECGLGGVRDQQVREGQRGVAEGVVPVQPVPGVEVHEAPADGGDRRGVLGGELVLIGPAADVGIVQADVPAVRHRLPEELVVGEPAATVAQASARLLPQPQQHAHAGHRLPHRPRLGRRGSRRTSPNGRAPPPAAGPAGRRRAGRRGRAARPPDLAAQVEVDRGDQDRPDDHRVEHDAESHGDPDLGQEHQRDRARAPGTSPPAPGRPR